uniref:MULE transposase domain-containing protein n=1 Tax=Panagrolaimus superbus TaxID=310955 RepID=A0A914YYR2_9BILA
MFPEWSLKLCNFHYHKNIRDYIHNKINANLLKNQEFVKWKAEIVGASFLPLNKQQEFINFQMQNLPEVPRNLVADVQTFKQYYMENWIPKLELINYYDFKGPRTTNSCEGFHSGLNTLIKENRPTFRS